MRVGLVVPGFSADANDWCIPALRDLVRQLAGVDELHVFTLRYPGRPAHYELFGARVTALGGGEARGLRTAGVWRRTASALAAEHRAHPFDVLHAFWAGEPGFVTALLGRVLRIPTVVSLAGGELARLRDIGYGGLLRRAERIKTRLALRLARVVTAGSATTVASATSWLGSQPSPRMRRIPLGVDLAMFAPADVRPQDGTPRLLNVASLSRVKDQATLLLAAALLRERGYAFELEIAGSGPLQVELRALAGRLDLDPLVRWRGEIAHDRLPREYQRAQLFVLSSRHEAQSMVALEAAASGLPVVGTSVGVLPELAPAAARVAPVGDAQGLADAIAGLLDDEPSRIRSGRAARTRAVAEYGLERCATRFHDLYVEVASGDAIPLDAG
jgi:glycosyltransferase involved in cell wall biosynthesis